MLLGIVSVILLSLAVVFALAGALTAIQQRTRLEPGVRDGLGELKGFVREVEATIHACKRNQASSTDEWSINYYDEKITALEAKRQKYLDRIAELKTGSAAYRPAVTSGCGHASLVDVDESSTGTIIAWLCEKCGAQLDETDRAVKAYLKRQDQARLRALADSEWKEI